MKPNINGLEDRCVLCWEMYSCLHWRCLLTDIMVAVSHCFYIVNIASVLAKVDELRSSRVPGWPVVQMEGRGSPNLSGSFFKLHHPLFMTSFMKLWCRRRLRHKTFLTPRDKHSVSKSGKPSRTHCEYSVILILCKWIVAGQHLEARERSQGTTTAVWAASVRTYLKTFMEFTVCLPYIYSRSSI